MTENKKTSNARYLASEKGLEAKRRAGNKWYHGNARGVWLYQLKTKYGITEEDYNNLLEQQNGLCAICKQPPDAGSKGRTWRLHVDHDHRTNEVRGLLCDNCNRGIGLFQESVSNLEAATDYLKGYWRKYLSR